MTWLEPVSTSKFARCPLMRTDIIILFKGPVVDSNSLVSTELRWPLPLTEAKVEDGMINKKS